MKITKVYTKTGDLGTTSIVGGARLSKSDARIEAYGTVDELSCHLGLLAAEMAEGDDRNNIFRIQNTLFNVCSHLATDQATTPLYPSCRMPEGEVEWMEQRIDECNALFFRIPGIHSARRLPCCSTSPCGKGCMPKSGETRGSPVTNDNYFC